MLKKQNILIKLLIINVSVFLLFKVINLFFIFTGNEDKYNAFTYLFCVPSHLKTLILRFWTPITYMFFHTGFFHILFNMLVLFFIGRLLIMFVKEKDFLTIYILGGLFGALFYVLAFNIFPFFDEVRSVSVALGASASVMAVVFAIGIYKPDFDVYLFGIIKLKLFWLLIILIISDIFLIPYENSGGHIAHLGGAFYGTLFGINLRKNKTISKKFASFMDRFIKWDFKFEKKPKVKVIKNELHTKDNYKYNSTKNEIKSEIDRILDKISKFGYQSLSKKEKEFLNQFKDNL